MNKARRLEAIYNKNAIITVQMASSSEVEVESVKRQVDIYKQLAKCLDAQDLASYDKVKMYKQMRKQLHANMKRYSKEGKGDLARMISQSLAA
jgi:hypothetical protein